MIKHGIVYLVGAGPGDPDLISVKGVKCLQKADVVIYDRLVNGELLAYPPPWAELVYVGKEPEDRRVSTNDRTIDSSPSGKPPATIINDTRAAQHGWASTPVESSPAGSRPTAEQTKFGANSVCTAVASNPSAQHGWASTPVESSPAGSRPTALACAPGNDKGPRITQDEIHALMVRRAQQGQTVVRLKGGDPFVFGRGGEECLALAEAGIPFEVVPGISSALAAPAYAGIPVTQRGLSQSFTVVTGHTCGEQACGIDWEEMPRSGTLVILMGVQNLPHIAARLVQGGRSGETPASVIHWGTTDTQVVVTGTLANIAEKSQGICPPAVIVIGEVVNLRQQMNWFAPGLYRFQAAAALTASVAE